MILWVRNSGRARLGSSHCVSLIELLPDVSGGWVSKTPSHGGLLLLVVGWEPGWGCQPEHLCWSSPARQSQGSWTSYMAAGLLQGECPKGARRTMQGLLRPRLRRHTVSLLDPVGHKEVTKASPGVRGETQTSFHYLLREEC